MILMNPSRRIARDLRACLVAGPILLLMWARETQRANPIEFALPRLRLAALLFIRVAGLGYDGLAYNFHATA